MAVLPMFPLGSVLLPGEVLPLHVFEPRYRQMVIDLLASDTDEPEFGVTLIERGHEVGGGDHRSAIGTVAQIARIEAVDPQRYAVIAIGTRRIMVNAWLPDDPYPLADVDEFADVVPTDDSELGELAVHLAASHARVLQVHRLASELGEADPDQDLGISEDPLLASYHLVALSPLGAADRYRLLSAATPMQRLELLDQALDDVEAMLKFRAS
jgi:Lon protease-like protein